MTREFPDELLSAYLDGELSPAEKLQLEQRLATSETDRQLLGELRSLRGDLARLPGAHVDAGFADRVVRAALAAQAADVPPPLEMASRAKGRTPKWVFAAAATLAAAASLLMAVQPWRNSPLNVPNAPAVALSPADQLISTLRSVAPIEGQALVVRLQLPKDGAAALDAALAQAGIQSLTAGNVAPLGAAYRRQVGERLTTGYTAATAAVLIEAPLADIERALAAVASEAKSGATLLPEAKLDWKTATAEGQPFGESNSAQIGKTPAVLALDPAQFPLGAPAVLAARPAAALPAPSSAVPARIIILVEQVK